MLHLKMNGEHDSCHLLCWYDTKYPGMVFTRPYTANKCFAAKKTPNKHPTQRLLSLFIIAPPADGSTVCIIHLNTLAHKIKFLAVKYELMIWGKIQIRHTNTQTQNQKNPKIKQSKNKQANKQPNKKNPNKKFLKHHVSVLSINENLTEL